MRWRTRSRWTGRNRTDAGACHGLRRDATEPLRWVHGEASLPFFLSLSAAASCHWTGAATLIARNEAGASGT